MSERLIKIGELARRANVPLATVKHYLREGLIKATRKSGRTMSWYSPLLIDRLRAIKELQQRQFLPLDVIKASLDHGAAAQDDLTAAEAIAKVLAKHGGGRTKTRAQIIDRGADPRELDWLAAAGLAVPAGENQTYSGDDLALLVTLASARHAGIDAEMLPFSILARYVDRVRDLVAVELELFRAGVFPRADHSDISALTTAATQLSERLVILLRRKLLLPTLARLAEEKPDAPRPTRSHAARRLRRKQQRSKPGRR